MMMVKIQYKTECTERHPILSPESSITHANPICNVLEDDQTKLARGPNDIWLGVKKWSRANQWIWSLKCGAKTFALYLLTNKFWLKFGPEILRRCWLCPNSFTHIFEGLSTLPVIQKLESSKSKLKKWLMPERNILYLQVLLLPSVSNTQLSHLIISQEK